MRNTITLPCWQDSSSSLRLVRQIITLLKFQPRSQGLIPLAREKALGRGCLNFINCEVSFTTYFQTLTFSSRDFSGFQQVNLRVYIQATQILSTEHPFHLLRHSMLEQEVVAYSYFRSVSRGMMGAEKATHKASGLRRAPDEFYDQRLQCKQWNQI